MLGGFAMSEVMQIQGDKRMAREYYYTTSAPWGNYETSDEPIVVNCADFSNRTGAFTTRVPKGRLDYSLCYVAEGTLFFEIGEASSVTVEAGTVVVVPPRTPMKYGVEKEQPSRRTYWLHFTGSYAETLLSTCGLGGGGIFRLPDEAGATAAFTALLDEMRHPPTPLNRLRAAASAITLLTQLGRSLERGERRRRLPKSIAYIREHFTEEIDKEALAAMDGLGGSQYHAVFRRVMGRTPAAYITLLRMMKARELLLDLDMPITEVARECGYADALYFSRVFRREIGVSPSEYRRRGAET